MVNLCDDCVFKGHEECEAPLPGWAADLLYSSGDTAGGMKYPPRWPSLGRPSSMMVLPLKCAAHARMPEVSDCADDAVDHGIMRVKW